MTSAQDPATNGGTTDFFISYAIRDGRRWAEWISHQLEQAGYRTMMQSKDFVPGSEFIALIDRGLREAAAVIAVLTPGYMVSDYGRMEWQAAFRARPSNPERRLIPVRVADCEPEGLLASITYLDLLGIESAESAREQLLSRVRHAIEGRAEPEQVPEFPPAAAARVPRQGRKPGAQPRGTASFARHARPTTPAFPPADGDSTSRDRVSLLHLPGPRFGRVLLRPDEPGTPTEWTARIVSWVAAAEQAGAPAPDALLISGDLTENGAPRQVESALLFLQRVSAELNLDPLRVAIVPGPHDVSMAACQAYFSDCEADDVAPQPPYWNKWRHFHRLFRSAYQGMDSLVFDADQPWTVFELTDLRVVVAGFNSTMAMSHRREDNHGQIGDVQAAFFARVLRGYEQDGWLRVGLIAHGIDGAGSGRAASAVLRDSRQFEQLLTSLNLVVHGSTLRGSGLGTLGSHIPLVPPAASGAPQLLELTADGLARWSASDAAGAVQPKQQPGAWLAVGATFPAAVGAEQPSESADEPSEYPGDDETSSEAGPVDERVDLLDRIAQVCSVRMDRARIRAFTSPEPHLRVTYSDSGYVRTLLLGAITGEDPVGQFDRLVRHVHAAAPNDPMEIVYEMPEGRDLAALRVAAAGTGVRVRSLADFQGLPDLSAFISEQTARLSRDQAYSADQYVTQRYRSVVTAGEPARADVVAELQRLVMEPDGRFVLLLGEFGFGKTFALRELTRRLAETPGAPLPILIDLRALDRAHTVDGLIAAHLANHGNTVIDLRAFRYLLRQGRLVLIFDGFDELVSRISYERAADHLERLVQAVQDEAKIVVASRTQHFRSHAQVLTALGERVGLLPQRRILQLEPFDAEQIVDYLARAYSDPSRARSRYRVLEQINDLSGLAANPRLLAFLAQISPERLQTLVQGREALSAADLYEEIVSYWLDFEARRTSGMPGATPGLTEQELLEAVTRLAVRLWERGEVYLRPGDIREVAATLTEVAVPMTGEETEHALGSGSLLTRTDDGLFGFIHMSVCEWLVARHIALRLEHGEDRLLRTQRLTSLVVDFVCTLASADRLDAWVRAASRERPKRAGRIEPAVENALAISARLNIEVSSDLSGADLAGQDLSFRRFHRVDLTGADLSGALLREADLSEADLGGADLTGALLRDADLSGANLAGAKLDRAQLLGTRLEGARIEGSTWDLASVIGGGRTDLADRPELRAAAVAPPGPVRLGLAPAEVGVAFGYEIGRIPDPVSFHPRGTTLIYAGPDGGLLVCDAATGQPVRTVDGHRGRVYGVRHSPDGRILLTGAADGTARIWDADTLTEQHVLGEHERWVWPIELAPNGWTAATGDATGALRLWRTTSGAATVRLHAEGGHIFAAAFHPSSAMIATGDVDGTVRIWDVRTGALLFEVGTGAGTAFRVRFNPDGTYLASSHLDGRVFECYVGDVRAGGGKKRAEPIRPARAPLVLEGTNKPVYCLRYHPGGRLMATGDTGGTVKLWKLSGADPSSTNPSNGADSRPRKWTGELWTKHTGAVYALNFSVDGTYMASADSDGAIRLGDPHEGTVRHELRGHRGSVWPMAFRLDSAMMATSSTDGSHRMWDTRTGENVAVHRGHGRRLSLARFDHLGDRLVTSGTDGIARVWDARTCRVVHRLEVPGRQLVSAFYSAEGPNNAVLGAWDNSGDVHIWNPRNGDYIRQIITESDHLWTGKFSPNGDVLATAEDDDSVRLRYWTTGRVIGELLSHRGRIRSIAFSPDEKWLATGSDDNDVRIWDLATNQCVLVLRGHTDRVYSVAWAPESMRVASAASDGTARVWNVGDPGQHMVEGVAVEPAVLTEPEHTMRRGSGRLWSVAINPAGTLLATAGDDLSVRLWNLETGRHVATLLGHTRRVWSVDFSPSEELLVSSGDDGTALLWGLPGHDESGQAGLRASMIGMSGGWVAAAPDGRYKSEGEVSSEVWHVVGNCRFPLDALGSYLPEVRRIGLDEELGAPPASFGLSGASGE